MKIELEYSPEELTTVLDGLNNAIIAIQKIYSALKLGCRVPSEFELMAEKDYEELEQLTSFRLKALYKLYQNLLSYEE